MVLTKIFNKLFSNFIVAAVIFSIFSLEVLAASNNKSSKDFKSSSQTKIRSKIIDITRDKQEIRFIGNVIVENGDSSMLSKEMLVIYSEKKQEGEKAEVKRIDAIGNVKIFSEEFVATSKTGYYIPRTEQFVLEKDVIVNNGTSIASGSKFIYNLLTKKGRFVGEKNESSISTKKKRNLDDRVIVIIGEDNSKSNKEDKD